jgi:hypothetical protein
VIFLYWFTFAVNLLGLVLALWLGLYLVSRSPKYLIAWLSALTLWSLAGIFLNVLLAINPPPQAYNQPAWMHFMFPFWPAGTLEGTTNSWLQGWSVVAAFALWNHATTLMRPGKLNAWRKTRILGGYFLAILAIWAHTVSPILYYEARSNPLYLNSLRPGHWYPIFGLAMLILVAWSATNLIRAMRGTSASLPRQQFKILAFATLFAGLGIPLSIGGSVMNWPIPMVVLSLVEVIPVGLIGYGVARYSALVEGRTIQRDFLYNLTLLAIVVAVYLLASLMLVRVYLAPAMILVFVPLLAVFTHSLLLSAHRMIDWLFYRRETRRLRTNLQHLIRLVGEGAALDESLDYALDTLCASVRALYGLILIFEEGAVHQSAGYHWHAGPVDLKKLDLTCDDVVHLAPGRFPAPLEEAALLIPLYADMEQLGAILLGRPINSSHFAPEEVERLLDHSDRIGDLISISRRKAQSLYQIAELAETHQPSPPDQHETIADKTVEAVLRNLFDYTYLADSALANLHLVQALLPPGQITYLDRGKAVHTIVLDALDKLRPGPAAPRDPPPREWYPYLILRTAYLEETPNRDIMLRLYISEGTFNRTRRAAIRSLARTLREMEAAIV